MKERPAEAGLTTCPPGVKGARRAKHPSQVSSVRPSAADRLSLTLNPSQSVIQLPAKARERRVSAASRNVEVGGNREGIGRAERREARERDKPQRRLSVRFALSADVCGALGCRETEDLLEVEREDGITRVLCAAHVRRWAG